MHNDDRLNRIETKIDQLLENTAKHGTTLFFYTAKTNTLEKKVEALEASSNKGAGAWKLITSIAVIAAILEGFSTFFSSFKR